MGVGKAAKSPFVYHIDPVADSHVKLIAFDPHRHLQAFFHLSKSNPELYAHIPWGPWHSVTELRAEFHDRAPTHDLSMANPETFTFAIIDKTRPASPEDPEGELAGTLSFTHTSPINLSTEIGFLIVLPPYQRSHVASKAIGLALHYALERPANGGLGMRRVHWKTSTKNITSMRVAERMGFVMVGTTPWHVRYVKGKRRAKIGNGKELPPDSDPEDLWRDTVNFSLSWDRWEECARKKTQDAMLMKSKLPSSVSTDQ